MCGDSVENRGAGGGGLLSLCHSGNRIRRGEGEIEWGETTPISPLTGPHT